MKTFLLSNIKNIHSSLLPANLKTDKKKTILFYLFFYLILISTFFTIIGQMPMFSTRKLTQLFQVGWVISLIPLIMLDYKRFLKGFGIIICIVFPFLLYCLIALIFKIPSISYGGTISILLSCFIFIIGYSLSKYRTEKSLKILLCSYFIAGVLYALVVFFTKLKGYDLENQIYAFGDKNSAGPIFMAAGIIAFYVFSKKNLLHILLRWGSFAFFLVIIALSKNRAVLIISPIVIFALFYYDFHNPAIFFTTLIIFLVAAILLFTIPSLYKGVVIDILFNGKSDLDSIFSGRITKIILGFQHFKPFLGTGSSYIDCMPISFLCTYGILGFLTLIPILIFPFIVIVKYLKKGSDKKFGSVFLILGMMFLAGALFEGYGYIGTGAKVFILWFLVGYRSFIVLVKEPNKLFKIPQNIGIRFASLPKKWFLYGIQILLVVSSIFFVISPTIFTNLGSTILERVPSNNEVANYVPIEDIQIENPVGTMCVNQRITFGLTKNPINAEDASVYWSTGWIPNPSIAVNPTTGEVTALREGSGLLHIDRFRVGPNGVYTQFSILQPSNYEFKKLNISTLPFSKSFEHIRDEEIILCLGSTSHIYFDNYYVPDADLVEFVSSDTNVAVIENKTVIRTKNTGTCEISAKITNSKGTYHSRNKITVNVNDSGFVPTNSIDIAIPEKIYRYQAYNFSPIFNEGATDQNYVYYVNDVEQSNGSLESIAFSNPGDTSIKVRSLNNPSVFQTYNFKVIDNSPVAFECAIKHMKIGETKNAEQLGLHLVFKNGYKKIVTEDDLRFDFRDLTNRAWVDKNGFTETNKRTVVKAVTKGEIKLYFESNIDPTINAKFTIKCSPYSLQDYNKLSREIGLILVSSIILGAELFMLFVDTRKKFISVIATTVMSAIYLSLLFVCYGISILMIIPYSIILIGLTSFLILSLLHKKTFPINLLEDPLEFEPKETPRLFENQIFISIDI